MRKRLLGMRCMHCGNAWKHPILPAPDPPAIQTTHARQIEQQQRMRESLLLPQAKGLRLTEASRRIAPPAQCGVRSTRPRRRWLAARARRPCPAPPCRRCAHFGQSRIGVEKTRLLGDPARGGMRASRGGAMNPMDQGGGSCMVATGRACRATTVSETSRKGSGGSACHLQIPSSTSGAPL